MKDRRMIPVPLNHFQRLALIGGTRGLIRIAPEARHILHHQNPEFIRPIQLAGLLRLDMNPHEVQSKPFHQIDLVPHLRIRRVSEESRLVIGLVQRSI